MTASSRIVAIAPPNLGHTRRLPACVGALLPSARRSSHLRSRMATMASDRLVHHSANNNDRTIHILGVGNLGKYAAHALVKHNPDQPVTLLLHREGLVADWHAAGEEIECIEDGVSSKRSGFGVEVLPSSDVLAAGRPPIKHLIVATKTYNTTAALRRIRARLSSQSNILFLQNGMGITDEVSAAIFPNPASRPTYYSGICYAGIYSQSPFGFVHAGRGSLTIGEASAPGGDLAAAVLPPNTKPKPDNNNALLEALCVAAPTLGTRLVTPTDLRIAQLHKLAINSTINPFSVLFNCRNGRVFESDAQREALHQLLALETGPILRALLPPGAERMGFELDKLVGLAVKVARDTADNVSSMLQDVRAGRQTEVDYLNGYLVRQGMMHGVETPLNAAIVEFVKQASQNEGVYDPRFDRSVNGVLNRMYMRHERGKQGNTVKTDA